MKKIWIFCVAILCLLAIRPVFAQVGTATRIAGDNSMPWYGGFNGDGHADTNTTFYYISAICKDAAGNIYIADRANKRIRKIDAATRIVHTIAGTGVAGFSGDGGPAPLAQISVSVSAICLDTEGNVLFTDNTRIRKINTTTGTITTVAGGGASEAEGVPATTAVISYARAICVDHAGNIYYVGNSSAIRKVDAMTGNVYTVAGNMTTSGFSGDGGPALSALINPGNIAVDAAGNLYFGGLGDFHVRKIDNSGIITTIAGNGTGGLNGNGGPALNASAGGAGYGSINVDTAGNVYFGAGGRVKKIDIATGMIYNVGSLSGQNQFILEPGGSVLYKDDRRIYRLSNLYCPIKTMSFTDTLLTPPCTMRARSAVGVHGSITGVPAPGDSVTISVNFGYYAGAISVRVPYYATIDTSGATVYEFGYNYSWLERTYDLPGTYSPIITIDINGYTDQIQCTEVRAASVCDSMSSMSEFFITTVTDSVTTAPCVLPGNLRSVISGVVIGVTTPFDSVYIRIHNMDGSSEIVVAPVDASGDFTYIYNHSYAGTANTPWVPYWYSTEQAYSRNSTMEIFANNGLASNLWLYDGGPEWVYIDSCNYSWGGLSPGVTSASGSGCAWTIPFTAQITFDQNILRGSAAGLSAVPIHVNFGDGTDTSLVVPTTIAAYGSCSMVIPTILHTYTIPGDYIVSTNFDTTVVQYNVDEIYGLNLAYISLTNSCSPVTGTFYIDANNDCVADPDETRLAHWPYVIVNNTTGDTTNGWADANGNYKVSMLDTNSYTIISNHASYYAGGTSGYTLAAACPTSGLFSATASAGTSFTQDFGFICAGSAGAVDMSVSGWGWGFVPGDTGIISIWSSDEWGYTCNTLASSITLTIDSNLSYIGMWNGPAPTTVSGNVLTWNFSTLANLFDFTADVKVMCDTTAMMGDTARNTLYIAPTALTDPDLANNTYTWSEPIRTSWDPNDKNVSPKGFGEEGYIENGTPLSYVVRFQNTGTASARTVKVFDTLSANLDISTLQIVNSSHAVLTYQMGANAVQFRFNDIYLPDSTSDLEGSNGFVAFNILPKENLPAGAVIANTASIYFDYNPAVVTNTTVNTIQDSIRIITGADSVCAGASITLANSLAGGVWSVTNDHASVIGGVVTGGSAGVDTIVYTVYGDKSTYKTVYVLPGTVTGTITGERTVCQEATTTLSDIVTDGTWSSSSANATVAAGVVTGVSAGTAIISYSYIGGCGTGIDTMEVTVNPLPVAGTITGTATVCEGATTTLSNTISGGAWGSSTADATVAGGIVSGVTAGTATVSYSVTNGCGTAVATMPVTVNPLPVAGTITGTAIVCEGATTTLSNTITGGIWTSSSADATVAGGIVSGVTAGTTTVSYTVTNSCGTAVATMPVTVNPLPVAGTITGTATVCEGATTTLSNTIGGGTWTSSSADATVTGGVVSGAAAGTATVSYSVTNGCGTAVAAMPVTVNPLPVAGTITGTTTVCEGATTTLSNTISGGAWGSSTADATVAGGIVSGVTAGTATVSYSVTNGCGTAVAMISVTVNPLPVAGTITGTATVCEGATTTLSNTLTGGTWSSSSAGATVAGGVVNGVSAGTTTISYVVTNACGIATDTMAITINPLPDAGTISGPSAVCVASNITLTGGALGASWTSSSSCATVAGGHVFGVFAGTTVITCSMSNGCGTDSDTMLVTVSTMPVAGTITGNTDVCEGNVITLANSTTGGTWSSSNMWVASISAGGVITGIIPGVVTIGYDVTNVCGTASTSYTLNVLSTEDCNTVGIATTTPSLMRIYPNPTNGSFIVEMAQPANDATITITDISGKVVQIIKPTNHELQIPVFLTNLASGTYLIKVEADGKTYRDKVVLW